LNGETSKYLGQPQDCPNDVYQIMLRCWHIDPNNRPFFVQNLNELSTDKKSKIEAEVMKKIQKPSRAVISHNNYESMEL